MKASDALNNAWHTYQVTRDCLQIASRSIESENLNFLKSTSFINSPIDKCKQDIMESRNNANDYVILSLWIIFERNLLEYCLIENEKSLNNNLNPLSKKISEKISNDIEYWRIDDVLDIFKSLVDPNLIGQAKQIKKYRDWIAHKNLKKPRPQSITPEMAHSVLLKITQIIESI